MPRTSLSNERRVFRARQLSRPDLPTKCLRLEVRRPVGCPLARQLGDQDSNLRLVSRQSALLSTSTSIQGRLYL